MNIGIFTDTYAPSINGIVTSITIFKGELEARGHRVFIFCPTHRFQKRASVREDLSNRIIRYGSFTYPLLPEYRLAMPFFSGIARIRGYSLDVIHFHTPFTMGLFARYVAKRLRVPLVQTYHTHNIAYIHYVPLPKSFMLRFARWGTRKFCNACSLVISPSSQMKKELLSYGVSSRVAVLPTGIENNQNAPECLPAICIKYGIPEAKRILITVGRLGKEKNIAFLLLAYSLVARDFPDTILVIVGDGPEKQRLARLANKLGISAAIRFLGSVERKECLSLVASSYLFMLASKTETQGLALLEALGAGIPAVAVDALGVKDILSDSKGGFLISGDAKEFSSALSLLLGDREVYDKKSKEAIRIAAGFSPSKLTDALITLYDEVAVSG